MTGSKANCVSLYFVCSVSWS